MTTKRICNECSASDWEEIVSDIVRYVPNVSLWQCRKCKRVIAFDRYENEYDYSDMSVLDSIRI